MSRSNSVINLCKTHWNKQYAHQHIKSFFSAHCLIQKILHNKCKAFHEQLSVHALPCNYIHTSCITRIHCSNTSKDSVEICLLLALNFKLLEVISLEVWFC